MSERERGGVMVGMEYHTSKCRCDQCTVVRLQARARLAAEREAELRQLLDAADCPECAGDGIKLIYHDGSSPEEVECGWCAAVAKSKPEGAEEA